MKRIVIAPYDSYGISTFVIHGDTVHIGHFGGMMDENGQNITGIEAQTLQTFKNLEDALAKINLSLDNLLKVTIILGDISDFHGMHAAWMQVFQSGAPTRTTITSDFIDEHCLIQIEGAAGL
ncbi:MAG: RidA family protein [Anaerolineales bacterium]|nr:RidA family protein [Anaerolineales bacterium]